MFYKPVAHAAVDLAMLATISATAGVHAGVDLPRLAMNSATT